MKFKLTILSFLICPIIVSAQKTSAYNLKAAEIRKSVWETPNSAFQSNLVPEKYANESAVVLAKSYEMQRVSGGKFKFLLITATSVAQTNKTTTLREKIKLNDKAAIEKYSTLEYGKIIDKSVAFFISSLKNTKEVFVGVKIIKPSGKETIVNTDEEVILSHNAKDKVGKLAVPDLQPGDILDYYISTIQVNEGNQNESTNRYTFLLAEEYPVLQYNYKFVYSKKVDAFYLSANGAPQPIISTNEDGDKTYVFSGSDMPKYKDELWSSPYRDLPYFCISSSFLTSAQKSVMNNRHYRTEKVDVKVSRLNNYLDNFKAIFNNPLYRFSDEIVQNTKKHFNSSKEYKNAPLDSTMKLLYNNWKFSTFFFYEPNSYDITNINYRSAKSKINTASMCKTLCEMEVPHDILVSSSKFSNTLDDVFEEDDFQTMIRINGTKPLYMCFDRFNTHFNEIPVAFQGESVIVLTPKRKGGFNYVFTESKAKLPLSNISDNLLEEKLDVFLTTDNTQILNVKRNVKESGFMRLSDQLSLLSIDDVDRSLMTEVKGKELQKRFELNSKKNADNYRSAFDAARKEVKNNFLNELTEQYGQKPKELKAYKILSDGILTPTLELETNFTLENCVKKAGSGYIVDIGKLIGTISKVDEESKARQTNVYMAAARSFSYSINFNIPKGYKATGVGELAQKHDNKFGSFISSANIEGDKVVVKINRSYTTPFIDKKDWLDIASLIDVAAEFTTKKILIEKI